jgi:hypothetical protein
MRRILSAGGEDALEFTAPKNTIGAMCRKEEADDEGETEDDRAGGGMQKK